MMLILLMMMMKSILLMLLQEELESCMWSAQYPQQDGRVQTRGQNLKNQNGTKGQ